jgi:hypothetical protein
MTGDEMLGVVAHPGGLLVERPELTVGLVRATASTAALEVELLARRPPDPRPADVRAPRHLLPAYDEGMDLRLGRLDENGRAQWYYPWESSSDSGVERGPSLRVCYRLGPLFDAASFVLAWPEIGFPETVVHLQLPDRPTVERHTVSIWRAPAPATVAAGTGLVYRDAPEWTADVDVETGRAVASPRLLHRGARAVVVLTRLSAVGPMLSMEVRSIARGAAAPSGHRLGASIATADGADAVRLRLRQATTTGGAGSFENTSEYVLHRPHGDALDLIVGWPAAGLPAVRLSVPIAG